MQRYVGRGGARRHGDHVYESATSECALGYGPESAVFRRCVERLLDIRVPRCLILHKHGKGIIVPCL